MNIRFNPSQKKFLKLDKKFKGFVSGYRGGKTFVGAADQIIGYLRNPQIPQGYFAPTYPQIRDIFYPTIEKVAFEFGLTININEGNKEVHFRRGRWYYGTTICRSMEKPGSIVGFEIGNALVDELDTMTMKKAGESWMRIIARLSIKTEGVKNGAAITTTPEGFRYTHKLFVSDIKKNNDLNKFYGLVQASTRENEHNLSDGYIDSLIATYPSELVDAYVDGRFTNLTVGTVYKSFNRIANDSSDTITAGEPLHIGMDFNVGKMAAKIFIIRNGDEWHCVGEIYDILDTPDMITEIKSEFPWHPIIVYPDASGDSRKSNNASESDIALLEQAGFRVNANPSNPRIKNRVMAVNKRFQVRKLFVNLDQCPRTADDLEQQAYDDNGEPDKKSGNDHGNDAFGYPIAYVFPVVKPIIKMPFTFQT